MRTADNPPFLWHLLSAHLQAQKKQTCTCRRRSTDDGIEWCTGAEYAFLGPEASHHRRSNFSARVMRPAADGWYPDAPAARPVRPCRCWWT